MFLKFIQLIYFKNIMQDYLSGTKQKLIHHLMWGPMLAKYLLPGIEV